MTITLGDPQSGSLVYLRRADLAQTCRRCGKQLLHEWICAVEGGVGWVHLDHLEHELLTLEMTPAFAASRTAREQLRDHAVNEAFVLTPEVLIALNAVEFE